MNYIIYPKEQENVIYPLQINHTVCVKSKSNTIFSSKTVMAKSTLKQNVHSFNVGQFTHIVNMIKSHPMAVTTDPGLTAQKGTTLFFFLFLNKSKSVTY